MDPTLFWGLNFLLVKESIVIVGIVVINSFDVDQLIVGGYKLSNLGIARLLKLLLIWKKV
jgi:hypothetical protein